MVRQSTSMSTDHSLTANSWAETASWAGKNLSETVELWAGDSTCFGGHTATVATSQLFCFKGFALWLRIGLAGFVKLFTSSRLTSPRSHPQYALTGSDRLTLDAREPPVTPSPPPKPPVSPVGLMVVGTEMAGFTITGVLLDVVVFGTMPWFTVGLTLLGLLAAFVHLVKMARPKPPTAGGGS